VIILAETKKETRMELELQSSSTLLDINDAY